MSTTRDAVTCDACVAAKTGEEPGLETPRPPAWVLRWMMPEVRRAYEQVTLEGISMQTVAWHENVSAAVISGRVNGARSQIHRLLRWEADRERDGKPLLDHEREPPAKYAEAARAADPLLAILGVAEMSPANDSEVNHVTTMSDSGADGRASAAAGSGTSEGVGAATASLLGDSPDRKPGEIDPDVDLSEFFPDEDQVVDAAPAPHEEVIRPAERAELEALLPFFEGLTENQRSVVNATLDGETVAIISQRTGSSVHSVMTTLSMSYAKLRRLQAAAAARGLSPDEAITDETTPAIARLRRKRLHVLQDDAGDQRARGATIAPHRLSREEIAAGEALEYPDVERPRTRGDCDEMPRPCPFVSCRHHLYLDVNDDTGAIKLNFPHLEPWELVETCSLDVADREGVTLEETGAILNVTRERVRQIEMRALKFAEENVKRGKIPIDIPDDDDHASPMELLQRAG